MGILGNAFGWSQSPIYKALDQHRSALGSAFGGLATGLPSQAASGFVNGLNAGNIADLQQAKEAAEVKKQQDQVNATLTYLQNKAPDLYQGVQAGVIDPNAAWMEAIKRSQPTAAARPIEINGQLVDPNTGKVLGDYRDPTARGGASETSLNPTYGRDTDPNSPTYGQIILGQLNKSGQFVRTNLPQGVEILGPGEVAGDRTTGATDAKTAATARAALPAAEQAYALTNQAINTIMKNSEGVSQNFGNVLGIPTQKLPAYPGSSLADMRNQIDQLSGTAFLQIRQALKGAGQVTDYEGQKGEIALNRMKAAADSGSKADFDAALVDYKTAIDNGLALLREQANGAYSAPRPGSPTTATPSANRTSNGIQWSVSP